MCKLLLFMVPFCEYYNLTKQHIYGFKVTKMSYSRTYLIRKSNISSFNCDFDRKFYNLKIEQI